MAGADHEQRQAGGGERAEDLGDAQGCGHDQPEGADALDMAAERVLDTAEGLEVGSVGLEHQDCVADGDPRGRAEDVRGPGAGGGLDELDLAAQVADELLGVPGGDVGDDLGA